MVEEELEGRLGRRARLRRSTPLLFVDDEEADAPGRRASYAQPERRPLASSSASARPTCAPQRQAGLLDRPGQGHARRPHARAVPRPRADHARLHAAATPARPCSQNLRAALGARRGASTTSGSALGELGLGDAGADEITDVVSLPGHRQLQARHHELDGPQRAPSRSASRRWRSPTRSRARIHIKMSGCPNGCSQHHIANIGFYGASIKVGEHTIPAYVAHIGGNYEGGEVVYGTRLKVRLPAKRVPGRGRALDRASTRPSATTARRSTPSPTRVGTKRVRGRGRATSRCRSSSAWRP